MQYILEFYYNNNKVPMHCISPYLSDDSPASLSDINRYPTFLIMEKQRSAVKAFRIHGCFMYFYRVQVLSRK